MRWWVVGASSSVAFRCLVVLRLRLSHIPGHFKERVYAFRLVNVSLQTMKMVPPLPKCSHCLPANSLSAKGILSNESCCQETQSLAQSSIQLACTGHSQHYRGCAQGCTVQELNHHWKSPVTSKNE